MLGLERKLEPGIQRELVLVLGIQAELSFRCTSSQVIFCRHSLGAYSQVGIRSFTCIEGLIWTKR